MDGDLVDSAATGDRHAGDQLVRSFRSAEPQGRAALLDGLAVHAARGRHLGRSSS